MAPNNKNLLIGIDFDNTIVCYDYAVEYLSKKIKGLPDSLPKTKSSIKEYLHGENRHEEWTIFQGQLYGPGILYAKPFQGLIDALQTFASSDIDFHIISHRSRFPYAGPKYNLHNYAREWISTNILPFSSYLSDHQDEKISFLPSLKSKILKIKQSRCHCFIDDLPKVLDHPDLPDAVERILFNPDNIHYDYGSVFTSVSSWSEVSKKYSVVS